MAVSSGTRRSSPDIATGKWRLPTSKATRIASFLSLGVTASTGSGLPSTSRYQSSSTATTSPGRSREPVGRASATSLPRVVTTRFRVQRRSSQVRQSVSRSFPSRADAST